MHDLSLDDLMQNMMQDDDFDEDALEAGFESGPDNANLKIRPPYIFLIFFLAAFVLELFIGMPLFRWQVQIILGLLLIGPAFIIFAWASQVIMDAKTPLSPDEATLIIVENGPYRFSRHPIYLSYVMSYLGLVILFDIVWGMILFVPMMYCVIKFVIEPEESYLLRKFRGDYKDYQSQVRRWI